MCAPTRFHLRRTRLAAMAACFCLWLASGAAAAAEEAGADSGALDAFAPDGQRLGSCPLEHTDVRAEIAGFVARVKVTQIFSNPFPDPIEAVYTLPLSHRAAVDAMWMRTGDREIRGEIERRDEARRIYEEARASGKLAALLDQERPNIFTQSLSNLMPGASVEVEIHYVETLEYEDGTFEFSFPTVVGPRFIPGHPAGRSGSGWAPDTSQVPDASRITPPVTPEGKRAGHDISIAVDIDAGVPILGVESKLHEIDLEHPSPSRARIRLAKRAEIPNRDFVLRYGVAGEEVQSGMLVHRSPASDGYVTFLLHPPRRVTPETAAPKEMIFVIDRSGSQRGLPLAKAKETMLWILDRMNPNDTFQVIDFGSTAETLFEGPRLASPEMKRRARAHIEGLRANGGTMMAEAVQRAVSVPADGNRLRIVTFMTDGYIGNDLAVIDLVRKLRGTSRWFAFGTGDSVNRFLLENMAREGGGEVEYVLLNSPGDQVAEKFYQRIASPVLTDLSLEFRGLDVYDVFPRALSDVWAHKPLIVHARYRGSGKGRVIVRGYRQGEPYREVLEVALPSHADDGDALASMWARAKVDELMRRDLAALQSGSFPAALEEEIVRVALRHRLLTQFTSFVAVEERVVNESGELRTVTVPVEMPQGVTYEGVFGEADAALSAPMSPTGVNGAARRLSKLAEPLQSLTLGSPSAAPMRTEGETAREEARLRRPADISTTARKRLAPELIALLERGPGAAPLANVIRGKVEVKVELRDASEATLRALEAAGLQVRQLTDDTAIGWIEITALADLAEVDFVERVTLP